MLRNSAICWLSESGPAGQMADQVQLRDHIGSLCTALSPKDGVVTDGVHIVMINNLIVINY